MNRSVDIALHEVILRLSLSYKLQSPFPFIASSPMGIAALCSSIPTAIGDETIDHNYAEKSVWWPELEMEMAGNEVCFFNGPLSVLGSLESSQILFLKCAIAAFLLLFRQRRRIDRLTYTVDFYSHRRRFREMVYANDVSCFDQIRMCRATFDRLCGMLTTIGGLTPTKNMLVDEQVAIFLHILAHHIKNRVIQVEFCRSGESISRTFNQVLSCMMRLGGVLLKTPEPVPQDSTDGRWKWFKNCLGALDGTHIKIRVPNADKPRYRNRKGEISTNVLGVCSQDEQFIYVLTGWEGSEADGRLLWDAVNRPNGLKVPRGEVAIT
ncbi:protein ALP1-like [Senna tora]|uniref:Protein ALP1-like n=1 Tax=Senna tora TaxID=362788 RepID=A0A834SKP3_9FABA|nr:protein ALP1-like [Senna tora]